MKKIGLICLALVIALGTVGVGLAQWNETLDISGVATTGELDVQFSQQKSNDPPPNGMDDAQPPDPPTGTVDPTECGTWTYEPLDINNISLWSNDAATGVYNVAATGCELIDVDGDPTEGGSKNEGNEEMKITITNAYPSYWGNVAFTIDNIGTIPAHIQSIKLVSISKEGDVIVLGSGPVDLAVCETWYVDFEAVRVETTPSPGDDFSIHLSGDLVVSRDIEVDGALFADICVHVLGGAQQSTTYDFVIEIVCNQFNEQ